jgi:hypothetical protein
VTPGAGAFLPDLDHADAMTGQRLGYLGSAGCIGRYRGALLCAVNLIGVRVLVVDHE